MQLALVNFAQEDKRHIEQQRELFDQHALHFVSLENVDFRLKKDDVVCAFCKDSDIEILKRVRDATKFRESPLCCMVDREDEEFAAKCKQNGAALVICYPFTADSLSEIERLGKNRKPDHTVLNTTFVNALIRSMAHVFETMARVKRLTRKQCFVRKNQKALGDICALISMKSEDGLIAGVSVGFDEHFAALLVARMTGQTAEVLPKSEVYDGIGELLNIICGSARSQLAESGYHFEPGFPTVIRGSSAQVSVTEGAQLALIFEADSSEFCMQFVLGHSKE